MEKNYNNMLILGLLIIVCGIFLLVYSFSTHMEIKNLSNKIDFDELDNNSRISTSDKYYKHLFYANLLEEKLKKNANIPFKNSSCVYLDYAYHNVTSLYKLIFNSADFADDRKDVTEDKINNLNEILDQYSTCEQAATYKTGLKNLQDEIEKSEEIYESSQQRMDNFMYGGLDGKAEYSEDSEIQPAPNPDEKIQEQEVITPQAIEAGNTY